MKLKENMTLGDFVEIISNGIARDVMLADCFNPLFEKVKAEIERQLKEDYAFITVDKDKERVSIRENLFENIVTDFDKVVTFSPYLVFGYNPYRNRLIVHECESLEDFEDLYDILSFKCFADNVALSYNKFFDMGKDYRKCFHNLSNIEKVDRLWHEHYFSFCDGEYPFKDQTSYSVYIGLDRKFNKITNTYKELCQGNRGFGTILGIHFNYIDERLYKRPDFLSVDIDRVPFGSVKDNGAFNKYTNLLKIDGILAENDAEMNTQKDKLRVMDEILAVKKEYENEIFIQNTLCDSFLYETDLKVLGNEVKRQARIMVDETAVVPYDWGNTDCDETVDFGLGLFDRKRTYYDNSGFCHLGWRFDDSLEDEEMFENDLDSLMSNYESEDN